ncbi:hypothetical protein H5410_028158 [Solanum commersonii]|uniref:Zinc finger PMZ-type domain-containing protein n=1 Tax=Solanum commersonii TaxID=4109 RepID=A0A9J5Z1V6_SOLCO|nr:hypothetical protein H5410_028158 [Solanum commersonii]
MKYSCGRFQLDEMPCEHAMVVLRYKRLHESNYCSPFYSNKFFEDAYAIPIEPLPCESTWDISSYVSELKLLPLDFKRKVGSHNLNAGRGLLMSNLRGLKLRVTLVVERDTIERHIDCYPDSNPHWRPLAILEFNFRTKASMECFG